MLLSRDRPVADLRRLRASDALAGAGGAALLGALALDGHGVRPRDAVLAAAGTAALALAGLTAAAPRPALPVAAGVLAAALAVPALPLAALRGGWAPVGAVVMSVGAWTGLADESAPGLAAAPAEVPVRPAPPA